MHFTRRQFAKSIAAGTAIAASRPRSFGFAGRQFRLGLNTYSLRALPHDTAITTVISVMKDQQLQDCQLWSTHVEPQFGPVLAAPSRAAATPGPPAPPTPQQLEERKAAASAQSD